MNLFRFSSTMPGECSRGHVVILATSAGNISAEPIKVVILRDDIREMARGLDLLPRGEDQVVRRDSWERLRAAMTNLAAFMPGAWRTRADKITAIERMFSLAEEVGLVKPPMSEDSAKAILTELLNTLPEDRAVEVREALKVLKTTP